MVQQALCDPLACLCNLHFNNRSRMENQMTKPRTLKWNTVLGSDSTQAAEVVFCWLLAGPVSPPSLRLQHCLGGGQDSRVALHTHSAANGRCHVHQMHYNHQNCAARLFLSQFPVGSSPARLKSSLQRAACLKCGDKCQKMYFSDTNAMMCTGGLQVQSQAPI